MSDFEDDDDYSNVHHSQQAIYRPSEVAGVGAEMDERHRNGFASQEEEGEDIDDDSQQLADYLEQHEHGEVEEEDDQAPLLDDDVYSGSEGEEEMGPDDAQAMLDHLRAVWSRLRPAFGNDDGDDEGDEEVNEAEEEDGDEGGSEDSGEGEVNYNRTLPATHAYLGEDLDTVAGRTFLSSEQR